MKIYGILIALACIFPAAACGQLYQDSLHQQGYLYSEFKKGTVLLKNGSLEEYFFNYNTNSNGIAFLKDGQNLILTNFADIDTIYLEGKKFIAVDEKFYYLAANTKYPLLVGYTNVRKPLTATSDHNATTNQSTNQVSNTVTSVYVNRDYKWNDEIRFEKEYWIKKNQRLYKANNEKQVIKIFPAKAGTLKLFFKNNKINFSKEEDMIRLSAFCTTSDQ